MPDVFAIIWTTLGANFFLAQLIAMVLRYRSATSHNQRVEAVGIAIPGLSGLVMIAIVWVPPWLGAALFFPAVVNLKAGRALYEHACAKLGLFHQNGD